MIKSYSGNKIKVYTHVCLAYKLNDKILEKSYSDETIIYFDELPENVIVSYCKSNYPTGKAGGIGI
jgi:predicted house-cleaning NTP pyrophosphatase (Maf/HAM1 superfamily)